MNRVILYVSVVTIAFIVGITTNWTVNSLGGLAVDKLYVDASIPSFLNTKPVNDDTWNRKHIGCNY